MDGKTIIETILSHEGITAADLCRQLELVGTKAQKIYDILRGKTKSVTSNTAKLIHEYKPMYNIEWLTTGKGEMLNTNIDATAIMKRKNSEIDPLTIINKLIQINDQKDDEIKELRKAYEVLAAAFDKLAQTGSCAEDKTII